MCFLLLGEEGCIIVGVNWFSIVYMFWIFIVWFCNYKICCVIFGKWNFFKRKKNVFLVFYNLEGKNDFEKLLIYVFFFFMCILYIKFINYDNYVFC